MLDLVGNPEDRFSQNEAHIARSTEKGNNRGYLVILVKLKWTIAYIDSSVDVLQCFVIHVPYVTNIQDHQGPSWRGQAHAVATYNCNCKKK